MFAKNYSAQLFQQITEIYINTIYVFSWSFYDPL